MLKSSFERVAAMALVDDRADMWKILFDNLNWVEELK